MDGNDKQQKSTPKHGGKYGKLRRSSRSRKRRFQGNQHSKDNLGVDSGEIEDNSSSTIDDVVATIDVNNDETTVQNEDINSVNIQDVNNETVSSSAKKIVPVPVPVTVDNFDFNIILNLKNLFSFLEKLNIQCPECNCKCLLSLDSSKKCGLAQFLTATCCCECNQLCEWQCTQSTSSRINPPTKVCGQKPYEINLRAVLAFREIGRGFTSLQEFCKYMNMPPPMDRKSYRKSFTRLYSAYKKVANESLSNAADQVDAPRDELGVADVMASFDGTWQRRGYSSLNGVVVGITGGKVVDFEVLSKVCHQCKYWKKKGGKEYDDWLIHHNCSINHVGSSGSMEVEGVKSIYSRSVTLRKLRYVTYLGDGNSKSFNTVKSMNIYPERPGCPVKAECVGHVQKRVGARLRAKKVEYRGKLLEDGKKLCGAGRLTEKVMNTLQNYYGMVIRSNSDNLYAMKKGIAAILHHCTDFVDENDHLNLHERHKYCPPCAESWCKWQQDKATGSDTYKVRINIPKAVSDVLKPIFSYSDLGSGELLQKCLHGQTQNVNEAFNQIVWRRAPKDVFVARRTLELATASAVLHFNDGGVGILRVLEELGIEAGHFTVLASAKSNEARIKQMNRKSSDGCKKIRKKSRAIRKGYVDKENEEEQTYAAGGF